MLHYVGLDVSLDQTSLRVLDAAGRIVRETKIGTDPDAIAEYLAQVALVVERVGLEAGPLSQWLHASLVAHGLPTICIETCHTKAALGAMPVTPDPWERTRHRAAHAHGLGTRPCTLICSARTRELLADRPSLLRIVEPVLLVQATLLAQREALHRMVLQAVSEEEVCRRMMTVPGVGPITALVFRATVNQAERFAYSRDVGAHFGLTPRRYQSGETDHAGAITKTGDALTRHALYEAATSMLVHATKPSALRNWALAIATRRGLQKSTRRPRAPSGRRPAPDVARRQRVPLAGTARYRLSRSLTRSEIRASRSGVPVGTRVRRGRSRSCAQLLRRPRLRKGDWSRRPSAPHPEAASR